MTAALADPPRFRPILPEDVDACLDVFYTSMEELHVRLSQPNSPRNPAPLRRLLEHLVWTDPATAWLAHVDEGVVGFGIAHRREDHWFLAFLFVLPDWQARGVGRALLERCLPTEPERSSVRLSVCVEAIQPVSTGLYTLYGMAPRVPIYVLVGTPRPGVLPALDPRIAVVPVGRPLVGAVPVQSDNAFRGEPDSAAGRESKGAPAPIQDVTDAELQQAGSVDRALMGYERPQEHRLWLETERRGFIYVAAETGATLGYGYVQESGRIGPVGVLDPHLMPGVLGHLIGEAAPVGPWQVIVPGPATTALVPLLRAGLRFDEYPAIYSASWAGPRFDRYLPMNFALL